MAKSNEPNLLEKHAEKIALVIAGAILVVVMVKWVVRSPNLTAIGTRDDVPPSQVAEALNRFADDVTQTIERKEPEIRPVTDWQSILVARMQQPLGEDSALAYVNFVQGGERLEMHGAVLETARIKELAPVPALSQAQVTIANELIETAVSDSRSDRTASDVTAAHITAVLNYGELVEAWRDELKRVGLRLDIRFLDVVAERQQRLGNGQWGPVEVVSTTRVDPMAVPTVPAEVEENEVQVTRTVLDQFAQPGVQEAILQPDYFSVYWPDVREWGGWMHHLPRTAVSDLDSAVILPGQERPGLKARSASYRPAGGPPSPDMTPGGPSYPRGSGGAPDRSAAPPSYPGPAGGGPGRGAPGQMPGPGGMGAPSPAGRSRSTRQSAADRLRTVVENLIEQGYQALSEEDPERAVSMFKRALTMDRTNRQARDGLAAAEAALAALTGPQVTPMPTLIDQCREGLVQVWVHDLDVEPGKTYRYRLRVEIMNPLFGEFRVVEDRATALRTKFISQSEWSAPVRAPWRSEYFLIGMGSSPEEVQFEIFRQAFGRWVSDRVTIGIGQPVATESAVEYIDPISRRLVTDSDPIRFETGCTLVDIEPEHTVALTGLSRAVQVTILTPDGILVTRNQAEDKGDRYRDLRDKAKAADEQVSGSGRYSTR